MRDFLIDLTQESRAAARAEAERLLHLLPDNIVHVLHAARASHLPARGRIGSLSKPRRMQSPLATLLLTGPPAGRARIRDLDHLRAWAMAAALRFCSEMGEPDTYPRVRDGLRFVWLLCRGAYQPDPLPELPAFDGSLASLREALARLQGLRETRGAGQAEQIGHLLRLLQDVRKPNPPRRHGEHGASGTEHEPSGWTTCHGPAGTTWAAPPPGSDPPISPEDAADITTPVLHDFGSAERPTRPSPLDRVPLQLALQDVLDEDQGWIADFAALTRAECRRIWARAGADITAGRPPGGAVWCAASLLLGRPVQMLASLPRTSPTEDHWRLRQDRAALCVVPDVTRDSRHDPRSNSFVLHPPEPLARALAQRIGDDPEIAARMARDWLQNRRSTGGRTPRLSRLSRALPDALTAHGEDIAIAGLLSGWSAKRQPQIYYASFPLRRIEAVWHSACADWMGPDARGELRPLRSRTSRTGSFFRPDDAQVRGFFTRLAAQAEESRAISLASRLPDRLAAVTNFTGAVLNFVWARRPHLEALEPLSSIVGRHRPMIRIRGKGNRSVEDGRWLPVPAVALRVIAYWRAEVAAIGPERLRILNPEFATRIAEASAGALPPFLHWEGVLDTPAGLEATDLWNRVGTPALPDGHPAPANWARHYMRGALADRGLTGAEIDRFMGHGGAIGDPFVPTSGAATADLDRLRKVLDAICADLGIKVPGP
ncbi:MAG TPA: hypothetical protein VGC40_12735 [Paenirhodobacter sp.]